MSRRYSHSNNILRFTKNEKNVFKAISEIIRILLLMVTETIKGIISLSKYINRIIINHKALKNIGYSLDEIMDELVYNITPRQFEVMICELFHQHGYKTRLTAPSNDYGRDVILDDNIFVECKHYSKNNYVGREICQKLLGSVQMMNAKRGIIVTTGQYHRNAYEVAGRVDNLQLMDITDIQTMILDLDTSRISKVVMKTMNAS